MEKQYNRINITQVFDVRSIIYLGKRKVSEIVPCRKRYDFWQLYYCKKGVLRIERDGSVITVPEHYAAFLSPKGDLRTVLSDETSDGEFYFASFEINSDAMDMFCEKTFELFGSEPRIIDEFYNAGIRLITPIKLNESVQGVRERDNTHPAAMQYLKTLLEQLLIKIYCRRCGIDNFINESEKTNKLNYEQSIASKADAFMMNNVSKGLTTMEIADGIGVNVNTLRIAYKKQTGVSIMHAYNTMRMNEAKRLIHYTDLNFTQIAETLGFTSLYHFSGFFKEREGITLSEYSRFDEQQR